MNHIATVLIAADDPDLSGDISGRMARNGYLGRLASDPAAAIEQVRRETPDVIMLSATLPDPLALARDLKREGGFADVPVCLLNGSPAPADFELALDHGIDDLLAAPFEDVVLLSRLRPLVRLSTMNMELQLRAEVAGQFGVGVDTSPAEEAAVSRVLLVGSERADLTPVLAGDADLTVTDDLLEVEDLLSRKNYDAAVFSVAEDQAAHFLDLCSQMRNNPRLFNLPVVLVCNPGTVDEATAYRAGASRLLERPIDDAVLRAVTLTLVRRQQRRWAMRESLSRALRPGTKDGQTETFNSAFLEAYLQRRVAFAHEHSRHLSVLQFSAPTVANIRSEYGDVAADHLVQQLAQWITGLIRAEDLAARIDGDRFSVVLPDSPRDEAEIVMKRIGGVIAHTDFALHDVYRPVKVWVSMGCAELLPGDDVQSLLARSSASA